jgi:hypothetical protein
MDRIGGLKNVSNDHKRRKEMVEACPKDELNSNITYD